MRSTAYIPGTWMPNASKNTGILTATQNYLILSFPVQQLFHRLAIPPSRPSFRTAGSTLQDQPSPVSQRTVISGICCRQVTIVLPLLRSTKSLSNSSTNTTRASMHSVPILAPSSPYVSVFGRNLKPRHPQAPGLLVPRQRAQVRRAQSGIF